MSATLQRVLLAACLGALVMACSLGLAMYIYTAGAPTLSNIVSWPVSLVGAIVERMSTPQEAAHPHHHDMLSAVSFFFGFPLGATVYAILSYIVLRRWSQT